MKSHMYCLSDPCPVQGHFFSLLVPALSRSMCQGQHGTFCKCGLGIDLCFNHCAALSLVEEWWWWRGVGAGGVCVHQFLVQVFALTLI